MVSSKLMSILLLDSNNMIHQLILLAAPFSTFNDTLTKSPTSFQAQVSNLIFWPWLFYSLGNVSSYTMLFSISTPVSVSSPGLQNDHFWCAPPPRHSWIPIDQIMFMWCTKLKLTGWYSVHYLLFCSHYYLGRILPDDLFRRFKTFSWSWEIRKMHQIVDWIYVEVWVDAIAFSSLPNSVIGRIRLGE
jgi:hypothetical protein